MIRTVRGRLTLWSTAVLAVVLLLYTAAAYAYLVHRVYAELDRTLQVDLEAAAHGGSGHHAGDEDRWVEIRDAEGRLVTRDGPNAALPATGTGVETVTIEGGERVRVRTGDYEGRSIRVARSEAHLRERLGEFLLVLGITLPLAVALCAAAGYLLARRTLAPVDRIVERARTISATRLDERLPVENPDDELGRLATAFNEAFERLEGSFARMKRFTGDAAHELRTPLTALRSVGEVCLRDDGADPRQAIASMLEVVERMTRLVDGLLRLARADEAQDAARPERIDLAAFARDLVDRLGVGATIEADGPVPANADPDLLAQALGNVIDNAVRHSPDDVAVRVRPPGTVEVIDRGPGIAPEHLGRIFDRFYRADEARDRATGGAGLGLAIARWAIEAQGGRIEVDSAVGRGSTFRITLPPG